MKDIVVIGGGASGLTAAIFSARQGNNVKILEKNSICGKKILSTGNGRCNYWNSNQDLNHFRSVSGKDSIQDILTSENKEKISEFFNKIGIIPKIKNGYYYPFSNMASSMQKALINEAERQRSSY